MHGASKYTEGVHMPPKCKTYMPLKKIKAKSLHLKTYKGVFENMGTSEVSGGCPNAWGHPNIGIDATEEN